MRVVYVAVDYGQKNSIRGVYQMPEGMGYEEGEAIIEAAYVKAGESDDLQPEDILAQDGFESFSFLTVEVS
jgi:hypothetical protein